MRTIHETMTELMADVEQRYAAGGVDVIGISSGIKEVDRIVGGFRNDAPYLLGARPGMGKTSFALTIAQNVAAQNKEVMFLSMEMGGALLALRVLSGLTRIPADRIERGRLSEGEIVLVRTAVERSLGVTFHIYDQPTTSGEFMYAMQTHKETKGLDFLIVDYVSLFRNPNVHGETDRLNTVSSDVRNIARICDIPVLELAQLNRAVEMRDNKMPTLSDFRDSGALEQDAFIAAALMRPQYYANINDGAEPVDVEEDAKFIVMKNRQGETGQVTLHYHTKQMLWTGKEERAILPPPVTGLDDLPLTRRVRERSQ